MKEIKYEINENDCHICISHCLDVCGYPQVRRNKKTFKLSRFLWEQTNGSIPENMCICHKCDTPACINIEHFFLGTQLENIKDRTFKNRQSKGENRPQAKLTEEKVLQIQKEKGTYRKIAEKYEISCGVVSNIKTGKAWKYIGEIK